MTDAASTPIEISVIEEHFPPHDPVHATPDPMLRRTLMLRTWKGSARFEQTDYGHAGRLNPWEPRGIDAALQPRIDELQAICDALTSLLQ
jgi:hypothetical protein